MPSVDVSIDVGARLGVSGRLLADAVRESLGDEILRIARDLRAFVLDHWPVLTSASLQEWEVRQSGLFLIVRNPIEYASYVHRAGETVEVWTEIRDEAERLVAAALPDLQRIVDTAPSLPFPGVTAMQQQVAPSILDAAERFARLLFRAKAEAYLRTPTATRDRLREDFSTTASRLRRARRMLEAARG